MSRLFEIICCLLILAGCTDSAINQEVGSKCHFHTTPDKWKDARAFHTPFDDTWSDWIVVRRTPLAQVANEKVFSPNKAYWYSATQQDTMKKGPYKLQIDIYNEREYLVRLDMLNIYGNFKPHVKWINEKLLYVQVWWGRVKGVDLIFDVENERVIHKENINYGIIPFLQWQQAKGKRN